MFPVVIYTHKLGKCSVMILSKSCKNMDYFTLQINDRDWKTQKMGFPFGTDGLTNMF